VPPSLVLGGGRMNFRSACIFIDGENLRHSICDLFTPTEFQPSEYLPKQANWQAFFDYLVRAASADFRLRTYWYTVAEIDFWPYNLPRLVRPSEQANLEKVIHQNEIYRNETLAITSPAVRQARIQAIGQELLTRQRQMLDRFNGWQTVQNGIASKVESVEFRRAGSIRYDLFSKKLGGEKGVDVKLATDLITLTAIYDVAVILSGDGDYVPAVQAVKDRGKHVINVSFLKKSGGVLPGGARRLNQATDRVIEVPHDVVSEHLLTQATQIALPAQSGSIAVT
jgi:uncharacterized LabA/DUF88 family protein